MVHQKGIKISSLKDGRKLHGRKLDQISSKSNQNCTYGIMVPKVKYGLKFQFHPLALESFSKTMLPF
jgi:hypothetical protein